MSDNKQFLEFSIFVHYLLLFAIDGATKTSNNLIYALLYAYYALN